MKYGKKYNIGICNTYGVGWGDEVRIRRELEVVC